MKILIVSLLLSLSTICFGQSEIKIETKGGSFVPVNVRTLKPEGLFKFFGWKTIVRIDDVNSTITQTTPEGSYDYEFVKVDEIDGVYWYKCYEGDEAMQLFRIDPSNRRLTLYTGIKDDPNKGFAMSFDIISLE